MRPPTHPDPAPVERELPCERPLRGTQRDLGARATAVRDQLDRLKLAALQRPTLRSRRPTS